MHRALTRAGTVQHGGVDRGGEQSAGAVLRQPDPAGERLEAARREPGRRAGHRAVHAADGAGLRAAQSVRSDPRAGGLGKFLGELLEQFGNLGLAAAAYNAGPRRVQDWMAKRGRLPDETRNYVRSITGQPAEHWATARILHAEVRLPPHARCTDERTLEAQAFERSKPIEAETLPSKKTIAIARASQKTFVLASADADVKPPASKSVAAKANSVKLPPVGTAALKAGARATLKTAAIKGGKVVSISAGPAAKRFMAMKTPTIMVPEKGAGRGAKKRPSVLAAAKPLDLKRVERRCEGRQQARSRRSARQGRCEQAREGRQRALASAKPKASPRSATAAPA